MTNSGGDMAFILLICFMILPGERASKTSPRFSLSGAMIPLGSSSFGIIGPLPLTILTNDKNYITRIIHQFPTHRSFSILSFYQ